MNVREICARIKKLITEGPHTIPQIVKDTGISHATLYAYMRGTRCPSTSSLAKLSRVFGVSMDYLVTGKSVENVYTTLYDMRTAPELMHNILLHLAFKNPHPVQEAMDAVYGGGKIWSHSKKQ